MSRAIWQLLLVSLGGWAWALAPTYCSVFSGPRDLKLHNS